MQRTQQVQCLECARVFSARRPQCPGCGHRESVPFRPLRQAAHHTPHVRRGALYLALAGTLAYFVRHQEGLTIPPVVLDALLPLLFLSALGLFVYGLLQR